MVSAGVGVEPVHLAMCFGSSRRLILSSTIHTTVRRIYHSKPCLCYVSIHCGDITMPVLFALEVAAAFCAHHVQAFDVVFSISCDVGFSGSRYCKSLFAICVVSAVSGQAPLRGKLLRYPVHTTCNRVVWFRFIRCGVLYSRMDGSASGRMYR